VFQDKSILFLRYASNNPDIAMHMTSVLEDSFVPEIFLEKRSTFLLFESMIT